MRNWIRGKILLLALAVGAVDVTTARGQVNEADRLNKRSIELFEAGRYQEAIPLSQRALSIREKDLGPDHPDVAQSLSNLATLFQAKGQYADAEPLYRRALIIREKVLGPAHPQLATSLSNLAVMYASEGRFADAELLHTRAIKIRKRALGLDHPLVAASLNNLAEVYRAQARYVDAEPLYRRAITVAEKSLGRHDPNVATPLGNLALMYHEQGRYADAEPLYKRALAIRQKALGADHPDVAQSLSNLATLFQAKGQYADAEPLLKQSLAVREKALGFDHPAVASSLNNLASLYHAEGRYADAEQFHKRALAVWEKAFGLDHSDVATSLSNLAEVYRLQARYADAEPLYARAVSIYEKAFGPGHPDVATPLENLALMYQEQGRYADAEPHFKRALAIRQKALGADHPDVARSLSNLATLFQMKGRYADAEPLLKQSLAVREKALGFEHPDVASSVNNLAVIYHAEGRYADAEPLYARAVSILEKAFGLDHSDVATSLGNLAEVYRLQARYADAEPLYARAVSIYEKALGPGHPRVATPLGDLAALYEEQGRYADAEPLFKRALAIKQKALGAVHPDVAGLFNELAVLSSHTDEPGLALAYARKATTAIVAHAAIDASDTREAGKTTGLVERRSNYFVGHITALAAADRAGLAPSKELGIEGFEIGQWSTVSAAADAVQQMAARTAAGSDALAQLVRESQDLAVRWKGLEKRLIAAVSKPEHEESSITLLHKDIAEVESRLSTIGAQIERESPGYVGLTRPQPVRVEETQQLLAPEEALVFWVVGDEEIYLFGLTREQFEWHTVKLSREHLTQNISAFRRGLNVEELGKAMSGSNEAILFDLVQAHDLYKALLGPVEGLIHGKRNLLVVPSGPMTGLPMHLLVTEQPSVAVPDHANLAPYRDAAWLLKRQAVAVLPSVASLKALRSSTRKASSSKPLIGFGDPFFQKGSPPQQTASREFAAKTRGYSEYWRGSEINREALAQGLVALPETADELKAVASNLGAPSSDIYLGETASETTIKSLPISDFRIVYFATHALVAGAIKGLGEPALALTLPKKPSAEDDGLLTASEVAELKLNADWVVLSACNTAAGDTPGAEALSGLARAFFYAGARALLVSHWAVASDSATRLMTSTFEIMKSDPSVGRAEALRRAMSDYLSDTSNPWNAHPAFWGPFSLVGEGASQ